MVKHTIFLISILLLSCGTKTQLLKNNITKVPLDNKVFKNKSMFDKSILNNLDLSSLYEESYGYLSENENSFNPMDERKSFRVDSYKSFYKFYSNGCVNYFTFSNSHSIQSEDINPEFNGYRGVLYENTENIMVDLFTIIGYNSKAIYGIDKYQIAFKGDTILVKQLRNPRSVIVYERKMITGDFLKYEGLW